MSEEAPSQPEILFAEKAAPNGDIPCLDPRDNELLLRSPTSYPPPSHHGPPELAVEDLEQPHDP